MTICRTGSSTYSTAVTKSRYTIPWTLRLTHSWATSLTHTIYEDSSIIRLVYQSHYVRRLPATGRTQHINLEGRIIYNKGSNTFSYEDHTAGYTV